MKKSQIASLIFSVCVLSNLFSQAEEKPCPKEGTCPTSQPYPYAYSAKAALCLNNGWSGFADASFIYWVAVEEGLYMGENAISSLGAVGLSPNSGFLAPSFEYHPGFKVGIGAIYDKELSIHAEYTWYRGTDTVSKNAPSNNTSIPGVGVWNVDDWFQQIGLLSGKSLTGSHIKAKWKIALDMADVDLSRPYHAGSYVTVLPFAGLRAAWIRQSVMVTLTQASDSESAGNFLPQPIHSLSRSNSWGIGPRIGLEAHLDLPMSWRLEASANGSLLATKYTTLNHKETPQAFSVAAISGGDFRLVQKDHINVCPIVEMGLGFGWGDYLGCGNYHLDFQASYDFLVFWDQNAVRRMLDNSWAGIGSGGGNLVFHGLTFAGRFDF